MAKLSVWGQSLGRQLEFSGRAGRREFWGFWLLQCLLLAAVLCWGTAWQLVGLLLLSAVPACCVSARRLHDIDRSAVWLLLCLLPLGGLWLLWWAGRPGDAGANRFGERTRGHRAHLDGLQA